MKTILDLQGFQAQIVQDFEQIFEDCAPVLVILDAGDVEALSGLEICKKIKNDARFAMTKVIMTSVLHDKEMILNCGADLYLPKPYEISALIKWVDVLLRE